MNEFFAMEDSPVKTAPNANNMMNKNQNTYGNWNANNNTNQNFNNSRGTNNNFNIALIPKKIC